MRSAVLRTCLGFGCLGSGAVAPAQAPVQLQLVVTGVSRPVQVIAPPGDLHRLFVVEQIGRIRIVRDGVLLPAPFLDLQPTGTVLFGGEMGLLGLAFHPDYATNGRFYVFHNCSPFPSWCVRSFTVSANPDVADVNSAAGVIAGPLVYGNHNGGMVAFGPDRRLWIGLGDGGSTPPLWPSDPQNHAQRGDSWIGKLLRIDVDQVQPPLAYGIPPDNPFVGPGDPRDEIWAFGLRNPWRFCFDRLTGDRYIADVGGLEEELDFEPAGSAGGRNYGWSCMSGTQCTGTTACVCNATTLTLPLYSYPWTPGGLAIIGGHVYRGVAMPSWRGAYFFGDYIHRTIKALRHNGTAVTSLIDLTSQLVPPAPFVFTGISAFGEDGYGELYVCDLGGEVYRIVPTTPVVQGVTPFGAGTPGCSGPHTLSAPSSPVLGHPAFTLRTGQAPPSGLGLQAFASQPDVAGSDPLGLGFVAHVQLASLLSLWPVVGDSSGVGSFAFAIPPSAALVGSTLHTQSIWLWHPAACSPSPGGWSSSPGLSFTVQP